MCHSLWSTDPIESETRDRCILFATTYGLSIVRSYGERMWRLFSKCCMVLFELPRNGWSRLCCSCCTIAYWPSPSTHVSANIKFFLLFSGNNTQCIYDVVEWCHWYLVCLVAWHLQITSCRGIFFNDFSWCQSFLHDKLPLTTSSNYNHGTSALLWFSDDIATQWRGSSTGVGLISWYLDTPWIRVHDWVIEFIMVF